MTFLIIEIDGIEDRDFRDMLLSKYKAFLHELSSDKAITNNIESMKFYHHCENIWFDEKENNLEDEEIKFQLDKTLKDNKAWRPPQSKTAYFPIPEYFSVAVVNFPRMTQFQTRNKFQKNISICLDRAGKAFDASHDKLTGLMNASAFNDLTLSLLESHFPLDDLEGQFVQTEPMQGVSISIVALDIDHFKQVNDTYSHVYGDRVLAALGWRLETAAQELREKYSDKINTIEVSRPSGEEFLILISGIFDLDGFKEIGEFFRTEINKEPLPSDDEWTAVNTTKEDEKTLQLPPMSERKITVSVGISTVGSRKNLPPKSDSVQILRDRADKALYIAKAGGRDTVRHFDEILNRHGRVLEH